MAFCGTVAGSAIAPAFSAFKPASVASADAFVAFKNAQRRVWRSALVSFLAAHCSFLLCSLALLLAGLLFVVMLLLTAGQALLLLNVQAVSP